MSCPKCRDSSVVFKTFTGAWFLKLGEETAQIRYCPECGTLLDHVELPGPRPTIAERRERARKNVQRKKA